MPANFAVPTNLPPLGPTGTQFSGDWNSLLDGTIDATLVSAGIDVARTW